MEKTGSLFIRILGDRDNGHKLLQKKLHLYIRRKITIMRTSSSLKMFKIQIDRTLDNAFERSGFLCNLDSSRRASACQFLYQLCQEGQEVINALQKFPWLLYSAFLPFQQISGSFKSSCETRACKYKASSNCLWEVSRITSSWSSGLQEMPIAASLSLVAL